MSRRKWKKRRNRPEWTAVIDGHSFTLFVEDSDDWRDRSVRLKHDGHLIASHYNEDDGPLTSTPHAWADQQVDDWFIAETFNALNWYADRKWDERHDDPDAEAIWDAWGQRWTTRMTRPMSTVGTSKTSEPSRLRSVRSRAPSASTASRSRFRRNERSS